MTLEEIFNVLGSNPVYILAYFVSLPVVAVIICNLSKDGSQDRLMKFLFGVLVYLACIPGLFALTLCGYTLLFDQQSFLNVNVLVYFLPVVSMALTLYIIAKRERMANIPGFRKLSGLMTIIVATFIIILFFQKTRIWLFFGGSIWWIIGIFALLFIVIKVAWEKVTT